MTYRLLFLLALGAVLGVGCGVTDGDDGDPSDQSGGEGGLDGSTGGASSGGAAPAEGGEGGMGATTPEPELIYGCEDPHAEDCDYGDALVLRWTRGDGQSRLPVSEAGSYDFVVEWGNGTSSAVTDLDQGGWWYTYAPEGDEELHDYWLKLTGSFVGWDWATIGPRPERPWDPRTFMEIVHFGTLDLGTSPAAFQQAEVQFSADDAPQMSGRTSMRSFFEGALVTGTLSGWDTSGMTDFGRAFRLAEFSGDVSTWDTSSVTDMSQMFEQSDFEGDVSAWDTSSVANMSHLFEGEFDCYETDTYCDAEGNCEMGDWGWLACAPPARTSVLPDIASWDTSSLQTTERMFAVAEGLDVDLSAWDLSAVTNMSGMFQGAIFSGDVSAWDTSAVTDMSSIFAGETDCDYADGSIQCDSLATQLDIDISAWDTAQVVTLNHAFAAAAVPPGIATWNTSSVTDLSYAFSEASAIPDLSAWDTSNVTTMKGAFWAVTTVPDVSQWDTSSVTDLSEMFAGPTWLFKVVEVDLSAWDISQVTDMTNMLSNAALPTALYDALLISWAAQDVQPNVWFDAGSSTWGSAEAENARLSLIDDHGWSIQDDWRSSGPQ